MFSNLLFLAIILLIATLAPETPLSEANVADGIVIYMVTLALIATQNWFCRLRGRVAPFVFLANVELICCLTLFWFLFDAHAILSLIPGAADMQTARAGLVLIQYFIGLGLFYWSAYPQLARAPAIIHVTRWRYIEDQLRFIVPFALPFLVFSVVGDLFSLLPQGTGSDDELWATIISTLLTGLLLAGMMIFFPVILTYFWQCQELPEGPSKQRLQNLCEQIGFRHAGMLTWPVMQHSLTAAIIGIVPRFRYVMFTRALLDQLSPESVEAVLIHEIGHNRRKHLILYPFIILGAMVIVAFLEEAFLPIVDSFLALKQSLEPDGAWGSLRPLMLFATYAGVVILYFRFVFGFFSRLFERQADLTIFDVGRPPEQMIHALDEVGILSGFIHDHPSWHHYSIRQRMDFLRQAALDHRLVSNHHRRVKRVLIGYLILLALSVILMLVL